MPTDNQALGLDSELQRRNINRATTGMYGGQSEWKDGDDDPDVNPSTKRAHLDQPSKCSYVKGLFPFQQGKSLALKHDIDKTYQCSPE